MKKYILPIMITLSALSLSAASAYYSVTGLAKLFAGVEFAVIWMATSLEISKLVIASLLYQYWKNLGIALKTYLSLALIILMIITSAGVYGYLSSGYQDTANKTNVIEKEITLINTRLTQKTSDRDFIIKQLGQNQKSISQLRNALGNNIQTYKDKEGNILTTSSKSNRKSYEKQLEFALNEDKQISSKINKLDSTISYLSEEKLLTESKSELAAELGSLKYISKLTGKSMDVIINWFLLIIICVFDPLAISLVVAANFAFKNIKKPIYKLYNENVIIPEDETPTQQAQEPQVDIPIDPNLNFNKKIENIKNQSLSGWRKKKLIKDLENQKDYM